MPALGAKLLAAIERIDTGRWLWRYLSGFALLALALALRLYDIGFRSIWMDEDAQARYILRGGFDLSMLTRSAAQQQPPLDYYLEYLGFQVFGVTPLGARFHAAVLGSLTVLVLHGLLKKAFETRLPVFLGTLLALLHPLLLYYSREGRPIACGVFFATLELYVLLGYIHSKKARYVVLLRGALLSLVTCGFMLSVGFQPLVFLASAALALVPGLFVARLRFRVLGAWLAFALGALGALPVLLRVLEDGTRYVGSTSPFERVDSILKQFQELGASSWTGKWLELLGHIWPLGVVVTLLGVGWLCFCLKQNKPLEARDFTIFLVVQSLLFPALFDATFHALIDYNIKTRYYLTLAPVLILLMASLSQYARQLAHSLVNTHRTRSWLYRGALVVLLASTSVLHAKASYKAHREPGRDWASMYALFKNAPSRGTAYMVHLVEPGNQRPGYYSQRFYYTVGDNKLVALRLQTHLARDCKRHGGPLSRKGLYFVVRYGWGRIKKLQAKLERDLPQSTVHVFPGTSVVYLRPERSGVQAATRFFEALTKRLPRGPESYNAYVGLAELKLCQGDHRGAAAVLKSLRALDPHSRPLKKVVRALRAKLKRAKRARQRPRR